MRSTPVCALLATLLCCGPAAAVPGKDEPAVIHVSTLRKPLLHKYDAVIAGLDAFERYRAHAPGAAGLQFRLRLSSIARQAMPAHEQLRVRLEGDDG